MKLIKTRILQAVLLVAIPSIGESYVLRSASGGPIGLYFLGLVALAIANVGVIELVVSFFDPRRAAAVQPIVDRAHFAKCAKIDAVATDIADLLRTHLVANTEYSNSLKVSNTRLADLKKQDDVRSTVLFLMAENNKLQQKMSVLSEGLEKSRLEIYDLRTNLGEAREAGLRDPLTALGNRRLFESTLAREIAAARVDGRAMCLVLADIDEFKQVNDNFGHLVGDALLKHFAELLRSTLREQDFASRFGGDEFAFILPRTVPANASIIVERIRSQLAGKHWVTTRDGKPLCKVTSSFGIAALRNDDSAETLIGRADEALYQAKTNGRNRISVEVAA